MLSTFAKSVCVVLTLTAVTTAAPTRCYTSSGPGRLCKYPRYPERGGIVGVSIAECQAQCDYRVPSYGEASCIGFDYHPSEKTCELLLSGSTCTPLITLKNGDSINRMVTLCHGGDSSEPSSPAEPCWSTHDGKYSAGHAGGIGDQFSYSEAKKKCIDLGQSTCKAITCKADTCTVRASSSLKASPSGETTYVPDASCSSSTTIVAASTIVTTAMPMTSTTMTTSALTTYLFGAAGTNECPQGAARIQSSSACKAAVQELGLAWPKHTNPVGSWYREPAGCFRHGKVEVYFNTHPTGGTMYVSAPICYKDSATGNIAIGASTTTVATSASTTAASATTTSDHEAPPSPDDGYGHVLTTKWCTGASDKDLLLNNGFCDGAQDDCIAKGKSWCNTNAACHGIMYHPKHSSNEMKGKLQWCPSTELWGKPPGTHFIVYMKEPTPTVPAGSSSGFLSTSAPNTHDSESLSGFLSTSAPNTHQGIAMSGAAQIASSIFVVMAAVLLH